MADKNTLVNNYDSKNGVSSSELEAGFGEETVLYEDRDSKVYVLATDLTEGSILKTIIDNGYDAEIVAFASDLAAGSGESSVMVNGYDAKVIFDPEAEEAGTGNKTKMVNGYDAKAVYGLTAFPPNPEEVIQYSTKTYQADDGCYYQEDKAGDELRTVHKGQIITLGDGCSVDFPVADTPIFIGSTGIYEIDMLDLSWDSADITEYGRTIWFYGDTALDFFRLQRNNNTDTFTWWVRNNLSQTISTQTFALDADTAVDLNIKGDGSTCVISVNGEPVSTTSQNTANFYTMVPDIFSLGSPSYGAFSFSEFSIKDNNGDLYLRTLIESEGETIFDVSGNGIHGEIYGDISSAWQESIEVKSYKNENGYNTAVNRDSGIYFDTGIIPDENTEFEICYKISSLVNTFDGCRGDGSGVSPYFYHGDSTASSFYTFAFGDSTSSLISSVLRDTELHVHKICGDGRYYIDGNLEGTATGDIVGLAQSIYLMGLNNDGSALPNNSDQTMAYAKIWQDGELTKEYIPLEDGTLLERVSGTIEDYDGTGDLEVSYIPRLETAENIALTNPLDIFGNTLEYYGRARLDNKWGGTNTVTFDSTNYLLVDAPTTWDVGDYIEYSFNIPEPGTANHRIFTTRVGASSYIELLVQSDTSFRMLGNNGSGEQTLNYTVSSAFGDHRAIITRTSTGYTLQVDDGSAEELTVSGSFDALTASEVFQLNGRNGSATNAADIELIDFDFTKSEEYRHFVFGEGSGDVVYDKVTGEAFTISGDLSGVWTTNDCARPNNLLDGCSKVADLNGTDAYFKINPMDCGSSFTFEMKARFDRYGISTLGEHILGSSSVNRWMRIGGTENELQGYFGTSYREFVLPTTLPAVGSIYTLKIVVNHPELRVYINDEPNGVFTTVLTPSFNEIDCLMARNAAQTFDGVVSYIRLDNGTTNSTWHMKDAYVGANGVAVIPDYTGGNDALGANADGIFLPALEEGTDDVLGFGLTNPGTDNGHNNSENLLLAPEAPELYALPFAAKSDGDDDYIDTGVALGTDYKIEMVATCSADSTIASKNYFFSTYPRIEYYVTSGGNADKRLYDEVTSAVSNDDWDNQKRTHVITADSSSLTWDDGHTILSIGTPNPQMNNHLISNGVFSLKGHYLSYKIWKSGVLVRDFLPIKSGDTLGTQTATANGMYDSINDVIYYNSGTGDLGIFNGLEFDKDGNAIGRGYETIQADYKDLHYRFADTASKSPIKFNEVTYNEQQTGEDLTDIYDFINKE